MEEKVFLDSPFGNVTSTKIIINGSTYATRNVGSVRVELIKRPAWPWLFVIIGLVMMISVPPAGLIVLVFGGVCALILGPKAKLHLLAGGGERMALESKDIPAVHGLHQAIVEAISAR